LYSDALNPGYERAQLICIDCQRLMDPKGQPFSDGDLQLLLSVVEREIEDAMEGYELELDARTKRPRRAWRSRRLPPGPLVQPGDRPIAAGRRSQAVGDQRSAANAQTTRKGRAGDTCERCESRALAGVY
jgi:hypothetical protein